MEQSNSLLNDGGVFVTADEIEFNLVKLLEKQALDDNFITHGLLPKTYAEFTSSQSIDDEIKSYKVWLPDSNSDGLFIPYDELHTLTSVDLVRTKLLLDLTTMDYASLRIIGDYEHGHIQSELDKFSNYFEYKVYKLDNTEGILDGELSGACELSGIAIKWRSDKTDDELGKITVTKDEYETFNNFSTVISYILTEYGNENEYIIITYNEKVFNMLRIKNYGPLVVDNKIIVFLSPPSQNSSENALTLNLNDTPDSML